MSYYNNTASPLFPLVYTDFPYLQGSDGVFCQENNSKNTLLFSLRNGCLTVCKLCDDYDTRELLSFIEFWSVESILSDFSIDSLNLNAKLLLKAKCISAEHKTEDVNFLSSKMKFSEYQELFALLSDDSSNFDNWFVGFSKRINNMYSQGVFIKDKGKIISTALATAICGDNGIISGVFTLPEYRNKGYASKCVNALLCELKSKNISNTLLWCEKERVRFYNNLGFTVIGEVYVKEDR